jgi:hypothetical protein
MIIQIWDQTIPGKSSNSASMLSLEVPPLTVRDLLRARVHQEVERYNQTLSDTFQGLVQPEESETILNGFRLRVKRPLDWETQFQRACSSFEANGFLILIDDGQVTELDEPIALGPESQVEFVKLVPLVGG